MVLEAESTAATRRRGGRRPVAVSLTAEQREALERTARAATSPQREALRARVVLGAAAGESSQGIAARLGVSVDLVATWRGRFAREGLEGLVDRPRSGRPSRLTPLERCGIMSVACEPAPQKDGLNGWTLDRLRDEVGQRGIAKISRSHL